MANETVQPTTFEVGVVRSTSGTERGNSTSPDPEMHCQQMFLNAISRINSNNPNVGKDEKATRFYCLGLRYSNNIMCISVYYEAPYDVYIFATFLQLLVIDFASCHRGMGKHWVSSFVGHCLPTKVYANCHIPEGCR